MNPIIHRNMTVMVLCALFLVISAQVTFSRDWSGGKRAQPAVVDCGQFARLCRHFIHELKQGLSDDKHRHYEPDDSAVTYEDEKYK